MPDRWLVTARLFLGILVEGYEAAGVPLPTRRYVSGAVPAIDCDQVTIRLTRTYSYAGRVTEEVVAPVGDRSAHTLAMRAGVLTVSIVRRVPILQDSGDPPTVASEEEAAALILGDAEMIPAILGDPALDLRRFHTLAFGGWVGLSSQGGYAGGEQAVIVGI